MTAVPAMGVVAETMVALVLAGEVTRKFGGDSLTELRRNVETYHDQVRHHTKRTEVEVAAARHDLNWDEARLRP